MFLFVASADQEIRSDQRNAGDAIQKIYVLNEGSDNHAR